MANKKPQPLEVLHRSLDDNFARECHIIGINHSIVLRSNDPKEELKYLANLGLMLLTEAKKIDDNGGINYGSSA